MKHVLGIADLSKEEIIKILDLAETFAEINTRPIKKVPTLRGKTVINLFLEASTGAIDITLYRDDVFEGLPKPEVGTTTLPEHTIAGKTVILVDDVLYTGRTIRAALDALMDYGRPRAVQLAVLVDRGHRELPIQPDYVGLKVETTRTQSVKVILDGRDRAVLREKR